MEAVIQKVIRFIPWAAALFITAIFLDSLRFKFTGHNTPEHIFTTLRDWSGIGLFYPAGPWVIGLGELLASLLLIIIPVILYLTGKKESVYKLQFLGALIAFAIMSGAIVFHLFTPLGIETPTKWAGDKIIEQGPALFIAACISWVCAVLIMVLRKADLKS